ncbi:hypothetical protein [Candidatus Phytoplasma fabacearum]|uniref:hypothetical protein n=1 Tax=Candidatus Phytoplasma fabacearum TaxID=2982628 RepID=UPI00271411A5|nr:hypothetical protein ['Bituminaria bituminosa' little leaf phytoplasma]MDV3148737.1 hypothetical protein [Pigeon pea little leaf phytoplasma]MDO7983731.1 hypothetical protein ['Bituminaria bituminosa' little leaf phytoplasma]MDO8030754.1 hypothetical protein ['Bituminaria bituminosa' little leaf phytoplasma]MDV3154226.1 hypothetical protein [Pigeon pea little leaf phytoplasma]MDV3163486.1 hypothetical protein [Pigeon pea little leaf phytoplasma]
MILKTKKINNFSGFIMILLIIFLFFTVISIISFLSKLYYAKKNLLNKSWNESYLSKNIDTPQTKLNEPELSLDKTPKTFNKVNEESPFLTRKVNGIDIEFKFLGYAHDIDSKGNTNIIYEDVDKNFRLTCYVNVESGQQLEESLYQRLPKENEWKVLKIDYFPFKKNV